MEFHIDVTVFPVMIVILKIVKMDVIFMAAVNGFFQNTKNQRLIGARSKLIHLYWLEIQKRKNGKKDILLDLKTEKSMLGMTV